MSEPTPEAVEELARVLISNWRNMHTNEANGFQRMLAHAVLAAGYAHRADVRAEMIAEARKASQTLSPDIDSVAHRTIRRLAPEDDGS